MDTHTHTHRKSTSPLQRETGDNVQHPNLMDPVIGVLQRVSRPIFYSCSLQIKHSKRARCVSFRHQLTRARTPVSALPYFTTIL